MSTLKGAVIVLRHGHSETTAPRAYSVSAKGVLEEPWLLAGLRAQAQAWQYLTNDADQRLPGSVGFGGRYPNSVERIYSVGSDAPGACCSVSQVNVKGQWKNAVAEPQIFAQWDSCDVRPFPAQFRWVNGVRLWEKLECVGEATRSTLYRDPQGKHKALRQRQHAKECSGSPRTEHAMSGVALMDGGLLLAGNDCQNHRAVTEFFSGGSLHSRLIELPGNPGTIYYGHVASSDPIWWEEGEAGKVTIVFPSVSGESPPRPYMARFDVKGWTDLSPPPTASGIPTAFGTLKSGGLWISTQSSDGSEAPGGQLWFDRSGNGDSYVEVLAPRHAELRERGPWQSATGAPWFLVGIAQNREGLLHFGSTDWEILPLPSSCASCGELNAVLEGLGFVDEEPVVVLAGYHCGCVARLGGKGLEKPR